jgi:ankyrin repeat protein
LDVLEVERVVNINARDARNRKPLVRAVAKGSVDVVIERGAEVDSHDKNGWTTLYDTMHHDSDTPEVSRVLLDYDPNVNATSQ